MLGIFIGDCLLYRNILSTEVICSQYLFFLFLEKKNTTKLPWTRSRANGRPLANFRSWALGHAVATLSQKSVMTLVPEDFLGRLRGSNSEFDPVGWFPTVY